MGWRDSSSRPFQQERVTNIDFCQIGMGFVPFCRVCDHLKPIIKDEKGKIVYNLGHDGEEIITTGVCLFTCEHYDVCKEAIDSEKILTMVEVDKNEIRKAKETKADQP